MAFWSSWKRGNKPREQFYGGSKEAYADAQYDMNAGIGSGSAVADEGIRKTQLAADNAQSQYGRLNKEIGQYRDDQESVSAGAQRGLDQSMGDYQAGRGATLANAGALEREAQNASKNYSQTAEKQFNLNQNRNQRAALALGSRGGAGGLRAALATSANANADAAGQAEITRANELNQLMGMKQNALVSAAGIRGNVGAQDQGAGQIYANQQQSAEANRASANTQQASNIAGQAAVSQNAGQLTAQMGAEERAQYLDAQANMENAALNAGREHEQQRLQSRSQRFNRLRDPLGIHGGT